MPFAKKPGCGSGAGLDGWIGVPEPEVKASTEGVEEAALRGRTFLAFGGETEGGVGSGALVDAIEALVDAIGTLVETPSTSPDFDSVGLAEEVAETKETADEDEGEAPPVPAVSKDGFPND